MNSKIMCLLLVCGMVVPLLLAACAPAEKGEWVTGEMVRDSLGNMKEEPQYGGTLRYCWTETQVGSWEVAASEFGRTWHLGMYDVLTRADFTRGPSGTGEFGFTSGFFLEKFRIGGLAESWEQTDLQTVIVHLQQGIHYHDKPPVNGREMVADDLVFCLQRTQEHPRSYLYKPPGTPAEEYYRATAIDKYTVEIKLPRPNTRPWTEFNIAVYAPELIEEYGDLEDWRNACGTGAWICTDYVPDSSITSVKNEDWWDVDPFFPENKVPYVDGFTVINIPLRTTALAALRTSQIDWFIGVDLDDAEMLMQSNPDLQYGYDYAYYDPVIQMRNDHEPFNDINVRKALTLGINRNEIAQALYGGKALVHCWPYRPDLGEDIYIPLEQMPEDVQELYEYNPEKAMQLLAEAGYPDGLEVELLVSSTETHVDLAEVVKQYWDQIGVETNVNVLELGTFYSRMYGWNYDQTAIVHWSNVNPFWITDTCYYADKLYNYSKVDDPYIIETSELLETMADADERAAIFKELGPYVLRQCWDIALPLEHSYVFWQPWVKGYSGEWGGGENYRWLDVDLRKHMIGE